MDSVTLYWANDLNQVSIAITSLGIMVLIVGYIIGRGLDSVVGAIEGRGLRDIKAELERIKAEGAYTREDMESAFDAGIGHVSSGEPAFDTWLTEADKDDEA